MVSGTGIVEEMNIRNGYMDGRTDILGEQVQKAVFEEINDRNGVVSNINR